MLNSFSNLLRAPAVMPGADTSICAPSLNGFRDKSTCSRGAHVLMTGSYDAFPYAGIRKFPRDALHIERRHAPAQTLNDPTDSMAGFRCGSDR